jgi:glutathione S-transferase
MKLLLNNTSPYARMVRIVMLEKGLENSIELCWCDPWSDDKFLIEKNPAGKIPALVCDSGITLSESLLIATYLDGQGSSRSLLPEGQKETIYHLAGLGIGLIDAAFLTVISRKYLNAETDDSVLSQRRLSAIERTVECLNKDIDNHSSPEWLSLGDITVVVALNYLRFRLPELNVAQKHPKLEAWRKNIDQRSSFQSTPFL